MEFYDSAQNIVGSKDGGKIAEIVRNSEMYGYCEYHGDDKWDVNGNMTDFDSMVLIIDSIIVKRIIEAMG